MQFEQGLNESVLLMCNYFSARGTNQITIDEFAVATKIVANKTHHHAIIFSMTFTVLFSSHVVMLLLLLFRLRIKKLEYQIARLEEAAIINSNV